jgi:hypothetical protein
MNTASLESYLSNRKLEYKNEDKTKAVDFHRIHIL